MMVIIAHTTPAQNRVMPAIIFLCPVEKAGFSGLLNITYPLVSLRIAKLSLLLVKPI
jgi:hypothetical protein